MADAMSTEEADWIPIPALQHYTFCQRQCGLIHLDHIWEDNLYALRGKQAHERVDDDGYQVVEGQRHERARPLWSRTNGLTGKADLVIFSVDGLPYPVEFKSGRRAGALPGPDPGVDDGRF
jgi:CRISPR-associated exonuclease Cas4